MIRVNISAKHYREIHVLGQVDFTLDTGQSLAIIGPSGAGKSTLLRIVAGLDTHYTGHIERPNNIGMVFQEPTLLPWRSVRHNLTLVHPQVEEAAIFAMLSRVGLNDKTDAWPRELSLGQQRRLSLARAFLGKPELLVMDEPFVSLDPETHADMIQLTQELMTDSGVATLLVTHDHAEARQLADTVRELSGSPATLQGNV